jgi:hypothetical protein
MTKNQKQKEAEKLARLRRELDKQERRMEWHEESREPGSRSGPGFRQSRKKRMQRRRPKADD